MNSKKIITQADVAERAGVSRAIVSYVLNNGPRSVSEKTRERVTNAIQELGYRPNEHAQRLRMGGKASRNSIGIVTGGKSYDFLERPYYNRILSGLYDSSHQLGQHIRFITFFDALRDPIFFNKNIHPEAISSLIFILPRLILESPGHDDLMRKTIERIGKTICLEESFYDLPAVVFDRARAARMAVEHLVQLGHRRIAFLAIADQRLKGYQQALMEHGIAYDDSLVHYFEPATPTKSAYEITSQLVRSSEIPTAIFAATDESAIAAIAAIKDRGLDVPRDIAIASIDNIEMASIVRPALTTVRVPKQTMANFAIQYLIADSNFEVRNQMSMVLPIELIVRESCGARLGLGEQP
jgi:DNA-binding LacI/PurR family transcriptional regulator